MGWIFRFLLRLIKKEHLLLTKYRRSHPHFFRYMGLDAAISVAIVVGGFQVAHFGSSWNASYLKAEDTGVKALSAEQVIDRVHRGHLEVYWLDAISGAKYSFEFKPGTVSTLAYLVGGGRGQQDSSKPKLIIQTFDSYATYAKNLHPLVATGEESIVDTSNYTLHFDSNSLLIATIVFKHSSRVVVIHYPVTQSVSSIIDDADALVAM